MSREQEFDSRELVKLLQNPAKFAAGQQVATPAVMEKVSEKEMKQALAKHLSGDWGELCEEDREANEIALIEGTRLLSVYTATDGATFWVITEADRSVTTFLLPEDY